MHTLLDAIIDFCSEVLILHNLIPVATDLCYIRSLCCRVQEVAKVLQLHLRVNSFCY